MNHRKGVLPLQRNSSTRLDPHRAVTEQHWRNMYKKGVTQYQYHGLRADQSNLPELESVTFTKAGVQKLQKEELESTRS